MVQKLDVIIIGAGFAGLAAAIELNKQGLHYIILEARNRVGGRVHTVQPWGAATDLGASWIHKINHNPLALIAKEKNIPVLPTKYSHDNVFSILESAIIYDATGKKMDEERLKKARSQNKKFISYLEQHAALHNNNVSVTDILEEFLKQNSMSQDSLDFEVLNYYAKFQQPILLFFTTGAFAAKLEKKTDKQIVDRIMETLRFVYSDKIPYPTSYLITHWGKDPFSRGSFSYPRIGSSRNDYKILSKPILNKIFFAGEATFSADPSTVTGAFLSGINAAQEITKLEKSNFIKPGIEKDLVH